MTVLDKLFSLNLNLEGLLLDMRPPECIYDCMPIGAVPLAHMGVDGVHYCIIPLEGDETLEKSPVYRISPMDFSEGTIRWAAKNIYDFINITVVLRRMGASDTGLRNGGRLYIKCERYSARI